ncbi:hypothetical protein EV424DRAFT_113963 [Suillus variegatus]|nr:hypothetical protein EV424DRAFT_113963 [Suillus variegatus]
MHRNSCILLDFNLLPRKILGNMQTTAVAPNNAPPAAAQYTEALGLPNNTPFNAINRASKVQLVCKSPINTLSQEIILHIFKLGVSCRDSQKCIDFAVLVSHVCHTWCNVALSCSSLWADITITTDNMYNVDRGRAIVNTYLLRAKEFASRSRVFPLSVRLRLLVTSNFVYLQTGTIIRLFSDMIRFEWATYMALAVISCDDVFNASLLWAVRCRNLISQHSVLAPILLYKNSWV